MSAIKKGSLPELVNLEKLVGQFMVYWGFKSIHGRIWLHLYLSEKPLDTAQLMTRLKVTKGLMSTAIRTLLQYKVIQVVETGRHGTVYYEANPELQNVITGVLRARERVMLDKTLLSCKRLAQTDKKELQVAGMSKQRVESVKSLTEAALSLLDTLLLMKESTESFECHNIFEEQIKESEV